MSDNKPKHLFFISFIITDENVTPNPEEKVQITQVRTEAIRENCAFELEGCVFSMQLANDFPLYHKSETGDAPTEYRHVFMEVMLRHLENRNGELERLYGIKELGIKVVYFNEKKKRYYDVVIPVGCDTYDLDENFGLM